MAASWLSLGWIFLLFSASGTGMMIYATIFFLSMVKFLVALLTAVANPQFGYWEVVLPAGLGALASVFVYALFGTQLRIWYRKKFPKKKEMRFARRRKIYKLWHQYGLIGVSFLSIVISPMLAVGIAVSFQEPPRRIILWNSVSIIFWTFLFATFRELVVGWFA